MRLMSFGTMLILGFHALLRPGELCQLRRKHFTLPNQWLHAGVQRIVVTLENPKNSSTMGCRQVAVVDNVVVIRWLTWILQGLPGEALVFTGGTSAFARRFRSMLSGLGLAHLPLTPGSLRAGGATALFVSGVEIYKIRILGRWRAIATLDRYLQEATAVQLLADLTEEQSRRVAGLLRAGRVLRSPPPRPWWCLGSRSSQLRGLVRWHGKLPPS